MKMKKCLVLVASIGAIGTSSAFAQSGVTMYGVFDTVIRHSSKEVNSNGTKGSKTHLLNGIFKGSRLGFKGVEDMGGGTAAIFQLEMGVAGDTGNSDQQGQVFGRQATVGLKNKDWGEINLGRQYGVAYDVLANYDPLNMGNLAEISWQRYLVGMRFDNTLKYTNKWGAITAEVQYSPGEQAGETSQGSTTGLGVTYKNDTYSVGIFNQRSVDANSNKANIAGVGATYGAQSMTFYLNYFNSKRDAGFAIAAMNSGGALANTNLLGNANNTLQRADNVVTAGLLYKASPSMDYTLGYMTDFVKNESSAGVSGRLSTVYAVANYSFSKNTSVYVDLDYTKVSGGEIDNGSSTNTVMQFARGSLGGDLNRTGVSIGLRTKF